MSLNASPGTSTDETLKLGLYKLVVEMADRISVRRGKANAYFLAVQTTLVTGAAALPATPLAAAAELAVALLLSTVWWLRLRSYRDLNQAKFRTVLALETRLPAALYTDEQAALPSRFLELGRTERLVPWAFAALHCAAFVAHIAPGLPG
ncbi:membrane protein [Streptomyces cellulosae]|nr:membrane protein [Streptomyces cellulosae]